MRASVLCLFCYLAVLPCRAQGIERNAAAPKGAAVAEPGSYVRSPDYEGRISTPEGSFPLRERTEKEITILLPDMDGDYLLVPGGPKPSPDPRFVKAQELKLKVRELVDQMLDTESSAALNNVVAVPASFVSLDDFNQTSGFGRYLAEAMFYEFNQRGVSVREYRFPGVIETRPEEGEFALSRALSKIRVRQDWAAVVLGTYYRDRDALFINARMVRASDGMVLRTAQLVLPMNDMLKRMSAQPPLRAGGLRINPGRK